MQIDLEDLRRHYESLTDDELQQIERSDLTEQARGCYDWEVKRRGLTEKEQPAHPEADAIDGEPAEAAYADNPDWLETALCVCTYGGTGSRTAPSDAENACTVLRAAGIPCQISEAEIEPLPDPPQGYEYRVMVPSGLGMEAYAVLDRDVFNEGREAGWRAHLESLTDEEFRAADPERLCAGLADGIVRIKRVYQEEMARRKSK